MASRDEVISPETVDSMIASGDIIVIFGEHVLRLNSWLDKHPGGQLAILHMVGRDATDEITAYHTDTTLKRMKAFRIGRKPMGPWTNRTPPIRGGVFATSQSAPSVPTQLRARGKHNPADKVAETVHVNDINDDAGRRSQWTEETLHRANAKDISEYPSTEGPVQEAIATKYRKLHQRIRDDGLYECPYSEYGREVVRYTAIFGCFLFTLHHGWYLTSALFLGLFWHQIMFTAHDAGHRAITQIFAVDTLIGLFIADFCCGLSMGWWKSSHNVHHLITNQPAHDPDIQNLPLFATCPSFFKSLRSTYYNMSFVWDAFAEKMVPFQKYTYYPVMGIARFNLYLLSWHHVLSSKSSGLGSSKAWWIRPAEIVFMSCYWVLFGYVLLWRTLPDWTTRVAFVLISHIATMPLHVQITLSHWGMSTSDLGESESFAQRQLRTTMDVDCPAWLDFVHGGLQFQAVHHLFPRVPRHNLRKVQAMVREFCDEVNIPYSILGFVEGNRKVLSRLNDVGAQVKLLVNCQKYMAETGESGLH